MPSDEEVVRIAAEAAEETIFSRYRQSEVKDLDVTVHFEDGVLDIDVYLNVPSAEDEQQVADDAALAARAAVDDLFADPETREPVTEADSDSDAGDRP